MCTGKQINRQLARFVVIKELTFSRPFQVYVENLQKQIENLVDQINKMTDEREDAFKRIDNLEKNILGTFNCF